jgi:Flp pilus assembly protein TadB
MNELALIGVAVGLGIGRTRVVLLGLSLYFPWVVMGAAALTVIRSVRQTDLRPALFSGSVAAELRSGSSLRQALAASARSVDMPDLAEAALGSDLDSLGSTIARRFPGVGPELELTVARVSRSGASAADLFDEIAAMAIAQTELRREMRVATAPARATAGVLLGAPMAYLGWRLASGDLSSLLAVPGQRGLALGGISLLLIGMLVAALVLRGAR